MSMIRPFSAGRDWLATDSPDRRLSRCQGADLDQVVRQDPVADQIWAPSVLSMRVRFQPYPRLRALILPSTPLRHLIVRRNAGCDYAVERLGDTAGVLIVDDTGFLKKGTRSAGVQRQYSGTAGRVENCQIGVFLAYASGAGHALIDRELYLPESWTSDRDRCRAAGIGDDVEFATKPALAQHMIERALDAKVPFSWLTADEAYGQVKYLRVWLEERDISYVLATRRNDVFTPDGRAGRADEIIAAVPPKQWRRISAGDGAYGPREYSWVRVPIRIAWAPGRGHWAACPSVAVGSDRDRVLHLRGTPADHAHRTRCRRRIAVAGRGMFSAGQERGRPGPVSGAHLPGLVCPHHLVDARPRLAGRDENRSGKGGIGIDDQA